MKLRNYVCLFQAIVRYGDNRSVDEKQGMQGLANKGNKLCKLWKGCLNFNLLVAAYKP